jgi:hypothetical protein
MRAYVVVSLALLFGSMTIAAQSSGYGWAGMEGLGVDPMRGQATVVRSSTASGCPVSLRALHGADGNMLKVDKNRPAGIAQLLHLIVSNPDSRRIVAARVRVRGLSGKGHVTQTSGQGEGDATRSLQARFPAGSGKEVSSDVWVAGMTAVLEVELNSVTFADGTTRNFAGAEACRIAPEPLMLIADR